MSSRVIDLRKTVEKKNNNNKKLLEIGLFIFTCARATHTHNIQYGPDTLSCTRTPL